MPSQPLSHLSFDAGSRTLSFTDARELRVFRSEGGTGYECEIVRAGDDAPLPVPGPSCSPQPPVVKEKATATVSEDIDNYLAKRPAPPSPPSTTPALKEAEARQRALVAEQARAVQSKIDRHLGRPVATASGEADDSLVQSVARRFGYVNPPESAVTPVSSDGESGVIRSIATRFGWVSPDS